MDPTLPDRLKSEAAGILAWLLQGCLEWQAEGLNPPGTVKAATAAYREEEDTIRVFINDCCETGPGLRCRPGTFIHVLRSDAMIPGSGRRTERLSGTRSKKGSILTRTETGCFMSVWTFRKRENVRGCYPFYPFITNFCLQMFRFSIRTLPKRGNKG